MPTFNERLAAARKGRGITQEQLAEAMNVSRQTVSHWENGRVKPDEEAMRRLREYLGLDEAANDGREEAAPAEAAKSHKPIVRVLAAFLCGALATLLVVYGLLPLLRGSEAARLPQTHSEEALRPAAYPFEWYQQPAANEAGKAYLQLTPDRSPVKLMPSPNEDLEYIWNIVFFMQETNGIPFTITKFTETFFNGEHGAADVRTMTGAECTRFWNTALIQQGQNYGYNVYRPMGGCIGYGAALEGIDANGNALAFGLYIPLSQELERVYAPEEFRRENVREEGKAYIEIVPDNDPIPLTDKMEFTGGKGWDYRFTLRNTSDVSFTFHQMTEVVFAGEKVVNQSVFTSAMTGCETLSVGGEPLMHNGCAGIPGVTGIGMLVEGADANGHELSFVKYVDFAQE